MIVGRPDCARVLWVLFGGAGKERVWPLPSEKFPFTVLMPVMVGVAYEAGFAAAESGRVDGVIG